jgi:tyrosyl-tRNA synthetase
MDIQEFLTRGVENIYPSKDFLEKRLKEGKKLTMYLGIDPTGPSLHLGHTIQLKKLGEWQKMGHKAVLLIGDFTATIGDPTDKLAARKKLTRKEVLENAKLYKKQANAFLNFGLNNPAKIVYNSKWLKKLNFEEVLELLSNMTVDQILKRDMFQKRAEEGKPIYLHEFLYPLMQGYDSVALKTDGEIGGNDQTFNMLVGRDLMKAISDKEKFVMTTKMLDDPSGAKMSKTGGNIVRLDESSTEMFGKIMSWPDGRVASGFELLTDISKKEGHPKEMKLDLAEEVVKIYHGVSKARKARENFEKTFSQKEIPEEMLEVKTEGLLIGSLLKANILSSKNEFKRLVEQGGITDLDSGEKVTDANTMAQQGSKYKVGKKIFVKLI